MHTSISARWWISISCVRRPIRFTKPAARRWPKKAHSRSIATQTIDGRCSARHSRKLVVGAKDQSRWFMSEAARSVAASVCHDQKSMRVGIRFLA
jgi:hypothetical protein